MPLPIVHLANPFSPRQRRGRGLLRDRESSAASACDHLITDHRSPSFASGPTNYHFERILLCHLLPTMSSSTIAVLTRSHGVAAKKRIAKRNELQEVVFDDEARQCVIRCYSSPCQCGAVAYYNAPRRELYREFLTGFRKRKQQRTEEKRAKRQEREKQERLEARRQVGTFVLKIGV